MTTHPSAFQLESYAVGLEAPGVEAHLRDCETCRETVAALHAARSEMLEQEPAERFLSRPAVAAELARPAPSPRRRWRWAALLVAPAVVAAAAILLTSRTPEPGIRLKGAVSLRIVRDRAGVQTAHEAEVSVRPADRMRFELTVTRARQLTVVLEEDAGPTHVLAEDRRFEPGVHYVPDEALVADDRPTRGRVLAGPPEAVRAVLRGDQNPKVATCRIRWQPSR